MSKARDVVSFTVRYGINHCYRARCSSGHKTLQCNPSHYTIMLRMSMSVIDWMMLGASSAAKQTYGTYTLNLPLLTPSLSVLNPDTFLIERGLSFSHVIRKLVRSASRVPLNCVRACITAGAVDRQ